ncbi:hypothetical protein CFN78_00570 [Amycolatopsis antarctica]|uniref:DUF3159 domain-containing protein n=2 Tax=Amycolatopsis antarctica TaxID=1854586 RepID=A0A263D8I7_9PSEU|nr:hypothetical protein CFN78_00570 [Amycolatopsis antarctica]
MIDTSYNPTRGTEARQPATGPGAPAQNGAAKPNLLDQLGGPWGMVLSGLPVIAFVVANALVALPVAIGIALAIAVGITVVRMIRGERFSVAIGGVFGVVVAGGIALWTGSASGFFLLGIWVAFAGAVVTLASLIARRPITGVVWNLMHGGKHAWRQDRKTLRVHDIATLAATAVLAARFVVKQWLFDIDATGWLATAKIAMGTPLTALVALVVIWAFRVSTKRLVGTK